MKIGHILIIFLNIRTVEEENERMNQEFRQGFAENINKMEESLGRFVQDHTQFLTDMSSHYGIEVLATKKCINQVILYIRYTDGEA